MSTITSLPTPPSRQDPSNFNDRADAFLGALPTFVTETNTVAAEVNSSANAVIAATNVTKWISGNTYSQGAVVWSPINGLGYRRITAIGSGTTDPSLDTTNYKQVNGTGDVSTSGNQTISGVKVFNDNLGLGVTPSAWASGIKAIDSNSCGGFVGSTGGVNVVSNAYYNGSNWIYKTSNHASYYEQNLANQGKHAWFTAPSGTTGNPISFTQAMTLDASGRLLVGITSAAASGKLIVKGDSVANFYNANETAVSNITYVDAQTFSIGAFHASGSNFIVKTNPSGGVETERLRVDSTGNVGISLSSPSKQLHLGSIIQNGTAGESAIIKLGSAGAEIVGYQNTFADNIDIVFKPRAPSGVFEAARIDSSGNLLVGTTTASSVAGGGVIVGTGAISSVNIGHGSSAGSGTIYESFQYNGATIGSITQNGTTAVAYNTSSDYRLKHDIAPMQNALQRVAALKPVTYKWNADGSDSEGFIAHELAEVCPQAVTGEKDAVDADGKPVYQGIDTSFLVATLTAAIQEQQVIINQLKARLDAANL